MQRRETRSALALNPTLVAVTKPFPPTEAALIAELIRRNLPSYDPSISREFVTGMNQFARDVRILTGQIPYENVVASGFADLWRG